MPSSACGTCKDRRLRCDRKLPSCSNCTRAHRTCEGYGLRLSWPKQQDRKRSLIGPAPHADSNPHAKHISASRWINVGFQDINSYLYLSNGLSLPELHNGDIELPPPLSSGLRWTPTRLQASHTTLLQYFQTIASKVITCDDYYQTLLGIITRLAFEDASVSSQAVLLSTLAVSSLFLYGFSTETLRLQGAATRALQISVRGERNGSKVVQDIAARMLLCSFEAHGNSQTSGLWIRHVSSAKELTRAVDPSKNTISYEFIQITSWVYHYDVIAQFSLRHWRRKEQLGKKRPQDHERSVSGTAAHPLTSIIKNISEMTGVSMPPQIILWSLADIFQNIVDDSDPWYFNTQYRKDIVSLEHRLESILNGSQVYESERLNFDTIKSSEVHGLAVLELYRLAALIYLERASRNFSGTSTKLNGWADAAFKVITNIGYCKQVFPIFIIACEAHTDEQRIAILDCIQRTTEITPSKGPLMVKEMVQRAWNLEDLEPRREISYASKLDTITSICETMPSFV